MTYRILKLLKDPFSMVYLIAIGWLLSSSGCHEGSIPCSSGDEIVKDATKEQNPEILFGSFHSRTNSGESVGGGEEGRDGDGEGGEECLLLFPSCSFEALSFSSLSEIILCDPWDTITFRG